MTNPKISRRVSPGAALAGPQKIVQARSCYLLRLGQHNLKLSVVLMCIVITWSAGAEIDNAGELRVSSRLRAH